MSRGEPEPIERGASGLGRHYNIGGGLAEYGPTDTEEEHGMGDVALQYVQLCSSPLCLHCGLFAQRPFLTMLHFPTVQFYFNLFYP